MERDLQEKQTDARALMMWLLAASEVAEHKLAWQTHCWPQCP